MVQAGIKINFVMLNSILSYEVNMLSEDGKKAKQKLEGMNQSKRRIIYHVHEFDELVELGSIPKRFESNLPSSGGNKLSPQERYLFRLESLQSKIKKLVDDAVQEENQFLEQIEQLDTLSQNLLMERYLQGKPLQKIIREFNYSESHLYRIYNKAFEEMGIKNKDDSK